MLYPDKASSGPYLNSAHSGYGVTSGVNRTSIAAFGYSVGNCAHCHEQHASIGGSEPAPTGGPDNYELFMLLHSTPVQSNEFCFGCHTSESGSCGTGQSCQSGGYIYNYSYSYRAGGDTSLTCPNSIYKSFQFVGSNGVSQYNCNSNVGTSHNLYDIGYFLLMTIDGTWGFPGSGGGGGLNPCDACHNPHNAQRDPHTSTGRIVNNMLVSSVSRPSQHSKDNNAWDLWGDDANERMDAISLYTYWAPYRVGGGYEPDGSATQNGSNLVSHARVCYDCHNTTNIIWSTRLNRNLTKINWQAGGDIHGYRAHSTQYSCTVAVCTGRYCDVSQAGCIIDPYQNSSGVFKCPTASNCFLNCTDCHEPHGSPNEFLLRETVNGVHVANTPFGGPAFGSATSGCWYYFCSACHQLNTIQSQHNPASYIVCGGTGTTYTSCQDCHAHCPGNRYGYACGTNYF